MVLSPLPLSPDADHTVFPFVFQCYAGDLPRLRLDSAPHCVTRRCSACPGEILQSTRGEESHAQQEGREPPSIHGWSYSGVSTLVHRGTRLTVLCTLSHLQRGLWLNCLLTSFGRGCPRSGDVRSRCLRSWAMLTCRQWVVRRGRAW